MKSPWFIPVFQKSLLPSCGIDESASSSQLLNLSRKTTSPRWCVWPVHVATSLRYTPSRHPSGSTSHIINNAESVLSREFLFGMRQSAQAAFQPAPAPFLRRMRGQASAAKLRHAARRFAACGIIGRVRFQLPEQRCFKPAKRASCASSFGTGFRRQPQAKKRRFIHNKSLLRRSYQTRNPLSPHGSAGTTLRATQGNALDAARYG